MKFAPACLFLHLTTAAGAAAEKRRHLAALPWSDLQAQVSSDTALSDASAEAYVKECYPIFRDAPRNDRTNHDLIAAPSGLCMDALFCAHERCNPQPEFHASAVNATVNVLWLSPYYDNPPFSAEDDAVLQAWLASSNTAYNLPHKVLFPRTAEDVVAAVKFAKEHGVKVSIKNSGHSYAGSSTMKDSLLINMMQYARYAMPADGEPDTTNVGVEECAKQDEKLTLENQACKLALARGKPAVLRVGGGENFDKSYRAVKAFNEKNGEGYKYHMIGGAAGSVSPMGWTWMGGLAATTGGRMMGFGVDQVLQIEVVLPAGHHVRFGPTEWEDTEGFLVPKTTKVSGECHVGGKWGECPEDINFDDLWFAMRGGGGGSWGVVLSTHLQLHDYLPYELVKSSETCDAFVKGDANKTLLGLMAEFALDFFLDPEALGVASGDSSACGLANGKGDVGRHFDCFGEGSGGKVVEQWKLFVGGETSLGEAGFTADDIATAKNCLEVKKYNDFGETGIFAEGPHAGKIQDTSKPPFVSDLQGTLNQLVPKKWMLENKPAMIEFFKNSPAGGYFAFGGDTDRVHDQMSSLSRGHREAGTLNFYNILTGNNTQLQEQYDFSGDAIPPYVGANHVGPNSYGPLKSDHSQPCPVWYLTNAEAEQMCVPILEAVYGTKALKRLEAIKRAIDPDTLFDCYRCVGNKAMPGETEGGEEPSSGMRVATALLMSKIALAGLFLLPVFLQI